MVSCEIVDLTYYGISVVTMVGYPVKFDWDPQKDRENRRMSQHDTSRGGRNREGHAEPPAPDVPSDLLEDGTDWDRVLAMTDEEAYRNALADTDRQPMTPKQLARMRRAPNPKAIRQLLGMNQEQFARQFQIAVGTLRDWEQGIHLPDSAAIAYLRVIERDPQAVLRALRPIEGDHEIHVHSGSHRVRR
jgi:putative transcriptional regulator